MKMHLIGLTSLIIWATWASCAIAQPNLNVASLPSPNVSYTQTYADTTNVRVGVPGVGVTWDFGQLKARTITPTEVIVRYLSPLNTNIQFRTLFPNHEVAVVDDTVQGAYQKVGGFWRNLGATTPATDVIVSAADPYDTRPIEVVFNDKHSDDFNAIINVRTTGTKLSRKGSATFVYDGYGTLRLPFEEIVNVARVTTSLTTTDTLVVGPATFVVTTVDTTTTWQEPSSVRILLRISTTTTRTTRNGQPFGTPTTKKTVTYKKENNSTSVFESTDGMQLWPHPVTHEDLFLGGVKGEIASVELVSVQGLIIGSLPFQRVDETTLRCSIPVTASGLHTLVVRKNCLNNSCGTLAFPVMIIQ